MKRPRHLNMQLKQSNVNIRNYVSALEKEINRLQKYNTKLEVQYISNQSKISALEKLRPKVIVNIDGLKQKNNKKKEQKT